MTALRTLALTTTATALLTASLAGGAIASTPAPSSASTTSSSAGATVPGRLLVTFTSGTSAGERDDVTRRAGGKHGGTVRGLGVHIVGVPLAAEDKVTAALLRSGKVVSVERDGIAAGATLPNDSYWTNQWGPAKTGSPAAWDTTTGSSSVTVAVLDSGVDVKHPDLAGRTVPGYDFINNDADPADDHGHGTKSTGVLGASSNNATGVAGTCWTCTLMPVKVLDSSNYGSWSAISNGIVWATDKGAEVISMSIYGTSGSTTLRNAVKYAYDRGVTVVVAAGNDASTALTYPASYPEVLSVAGTDSADKLYSWSQKGSWISLAAPGCTYSTTRGGGYGSYCGTSAATPHVAGIAGLMIAANPTLTRAQVAEALRSTAVPVSPLAHGRVDAAAAVRAVLPSAATQPVAEPTVEPTPEPTTEPAPTTTEPAQETFATTTFSGSLNGKQSSRSFNVQAGAGSVDATLQYTRASSLTVRLLSQDGTVLMTASGGDPVRMSRTVPAGGYVLEVSGSNKANFTLSVRHVSP